MPNIIPKDVDALLESELQMITQNNDALILANQQLTTQLNDNTKLLETKEQEVQQLRRELQACKGEKVHAERLVKESNAFSGLEPFPQFLTNKKAIIRIKNNDKRCFGYAALYFLEREKLPKKNCERVKSYTNEMFQRHDLDTLPYPISPQDVFLYEDQLQMNINVFSLLDDAGRDFHRLVISHKNYERVANFFYWKGHYAPITNISRLFSDLTKHDNEKHFCLQCLNHFTSKEVLAKHKELCKEPPIKIQLNQGIILYLNEIYLHCIFLNSML